jgi:D-alanyl-D-alanine carboxypeptidase
VRQEKVLVLKLISLLWFALHGTTSVKADMPIDSSEPTTDGNDLLVLVNKSEKHRLPESWKPADLVKLPSGLMIRGRKGELRKEAASALAEMLAAAREDGHIIRVRSAFRSFHTQERVFHAKERKYGSRRASRASARAGHSQHQLGTTVDLVARRFQWNFSQRFADAPEGKWLANNAHSYGFALSYARGKEKLTGYIHEPWHYRYLGAEAAVEMNELGISMENYLRACRRDDRQLRCAEPKTD